MKILCIEDQEQKYRQIKDIVVDKFGKIDWENNCQNGLMRLRTEHYDIVLLDMSMPICNEGEEETFDSYAGMYVLKEIRRRNYATKVIIITGFSDFEKGEEVITLSELHAEILDKYNSIYIGYVKYDSTTVEWQDKLVELITKVL